MKSPLAVSDALKGKLYISKSSRIKKTVSKVSSFLQMNPVAYLVILSLFMELHFLVVPAAAAKPSPQITVMGFVYCDFCSNNTFTRNSYFLPGVEVKIDCTFKAVSARTTEHLSLSVNRTTNKYGVYKLEIPSFDGVKCAEDSTIASSCQASLMRSTSSSCNVPGFRSTSNEVTVKSRQGNLCIYSLDALNYRPLKRNKKLCGQASLH